MWLRNMKGDPKGNRLLQLWKHDEYNIFIMDNHLGALWCWLATLTAEDQYRLLHIDYHWDMTDLPDDQVALINAKEFVDLNRLDEFISLEYRCNEFTIPLIDYTNYMNPLSKLRPKLDQALLTAVLEQYDSEIKNDPRFELVDFPDFLANASELLLKPFEGKTLFNVDLDFFFDGFSVDSKIVRQDYFQPLVDLIKPELGEQTVLTVALSPEICGSANSEQLCIQFMESLGLKHPF